MPFDFLKPKLDDNINDSVIFLELVVLNIEYIATNSLRCN